VCNRAELTLLCLQTLALRLNETPCEIVIVDNGSRDETGQLLQRLEGVKVIRNAVNFGFPRAVNQAARISSATFLLLLNNDAQLLGRSIDVAVEFLETNPGVGAVGGKIILLDGTLQEAGVHVFSDGWTCQYGRGDSPDDPRYDFQRDVAYCSAAFLMTRRSLFDPLEGLEEAFSPGYFEDTDYCVRLWKMGQRVVYLPDIAILHYENATSASLPDLTGVVRRNHRVFKARHADWLRTRPDRTWPSVRARTVDMFRFHVLLLGDDLVREQSADETVTVLNGLIARLEALDGFVTICLTGIAARDLRPFLVRLPRTVERVCLDDRSQVKGWLAARLTAYDLVVGGDADFLDGLNVQSSPGPRFAVLYDGRLTLLDGRGEGSPSGCRAASDDCGPSLDS
jgi:GT2 family glycosyltransferase